MAICGCRLPRRCRLARVVALSLSFKFPAFDTYWQERILFWEKTPPEKALCPLLRTLPFSRHCKSSRDWRGRGRAKGRGWPAEGGGASGVARRRKAKGWSYRRPWPPPTSRTSAVISEPRLKLRRYSALAPGPREHYLPVEHYVLSLSPKFITLRLGASRRLTREARARQGGARARRARAYILGYM